MDLISLPGGFTHLFRMSSDSKLIVSFKEVFSKVVTSLTG